MDFRVYLSSGTCHLTQMTTWPLSAKLAMTNKAATNTHIQAFVWGSPFIFLGEFPGVGQLGHMAGVCLTYHETVKLFSKS